MLRFLQNSYKKWIECTTIINASSHLLQNKPFVSMIKMSHSVILTMICCNFCYKQHSNNSNLLVLVCLIVRFDPNYFTVILHFCIVGFYFRPKYPGISFTPCLIFYKRFWRRQPYENKWIKHKKFIYYYFFNRWMIYNFTLPSLVFSIVKIRKADIFHNISHRLLFHFK